MKIKVWISTNKIGSKCEKTIEVDDEADEKEIEEEAQEAAFEMMEWSWEKVET